MLNLTQTIRQLNEAQKIRLLTDIHSLAEPEPGTAGVPSVRCGSPHDLDGGDFPAPSVLARSWDKALLSDVAEAQCRALARKGFHHVFLPGAKTRLTPFGEGMAEDPVLAGALAGACLQGANRAGLSASLSGFGLTPPEAVRLGTPLSRRNRYTHLDAPYALAMGGGDCKGMVIRDPSETIREELRSTIREAGGYVLCLHAEGTETVRALAAGMICLSGSPQAVQTALHNHRRLTSAIQQGKATTGELEDACAAGDAISEETLDEALERLLRFADACGTPDERPAPEGALTALQRKALLSSTVLLENRTRRKGGQKLLPLKNPRKVCLLGDLLSASGQTPEAVAEALRGAGCKAVTYARGYDLCGHRNQVLLDEAVKAASEADVVVLLLGMDHEQIIRSRRERRAVLPADQLALCDAVSRLNKDVVAVVSAGEITPDMSFVTAAATPFGAVLLAPLETSAGISVLTEVLMGKASPSGRLATSLCARESCPEIFREDRPVGPFVEYRYLDSLGGGALYPFGHGLTYTAFRYTGLKLRDGRVSFTVKNTGKYPCAEVAQVYLGLPASAVLRPRRELVAFERVELAPGESRAVTLTLPADLLPVCTEEGALLCEGGTYTLSVGSSVSEARLETSFTHVGDILPADQEHPEDYLSSLSNILSHHYLMEAACDTMKPSLRNLLFGIAALVLAVSVKAFDVVSHTNALFLDIVAGVLALGAVACFVLEIIDRRRQHALEDAYRELSEAYEFEDATAIDVPYAAALFADEDRLEREAAEAEDTEGVTDEYDLFADVDKDLTFTEAARELAVLAREKGMTVEESTLRSIFASLAVSRLAVVHGMDDKRFSALISLLGEYFACPAAVDTVSDSCRSETDLLLVPDAQGNRLPSHTLRAITAAQSEPGRIHLAALTHVDPLKLSAYFVPFSRHAHAPYSGHILECHGGEGAESTYVLSENLWVILNLKKDASVCSLPAHITEIATVNSWSLELGGSAAATHSEFRRFGYGQMEYLRDRLRSDFSADEETWKKLDRLEGFAHRLSGFRMSNKHWLGLEMYMATLMAFGAEEPAARDEAMSVKLMPSLTSALDGKIPRGERSLSETLDAVFGEDHTALCRKAIKDSGADLT